MTALERELIRQRRRLRRIEDTAAAELRRTYLYVYRRLRKQLDELLIAIREAEAAGVTVTTSNAVNLWQLESLLDAIERETWAFARQASEITAEAQRLALANVNRDALGRTTAGLTATKTAQVAVQFISLSPGALAQYVGFAGDGKPLGELLTKIAPQTRQAAQDTISYGIARGQSPRVVAQNFRKVASIPLDRALTISRTEMLRAYRNAAQERMLKDPMVKAWEWHAALDDRTCSACAAMNGTIHPKNDLMGAHVNCRCAMIEVTRSWKELGFDGMEEFEPVRLTPEEMFSALPEATQRSIMGNTRYDLYKSGQITLADNVKVTRSKKWGDSHVVRPLKDFA